MKKIHITLCAGTMCHVMGGGHLYDLEQHLPADWKARVEVEGKRCLGYCEQNLPTKPPYVLIDGQLLSEASLSSVIQRVRTLIESDAKPEGADRHAAR